MKKLIVLFVLGISLLAVAQNFQVRHIKTKSDSAIVTTLQVFDGSDEPVGSIPESNFAVTIDSKPVKRVSATTYKDSGIPLDIMLCVDLSGSMNGAPLKTMKNAILKFIDELRNDDRLAILGFHNSADLVTDFSSDKQYLRDKVNNLKTQGNQTALFYGASRGIDALAQKKENNGKILLLIGDGKDEDPSKAYKEDDVIEKARKEGIPIFTIGYSKIDRSFLRCFERISERTGGKFYNSPTDQDLENQYRKLLHQVTNIYMLKNYSPIPGDNLEHVIAITVTQPSGTRVVTGKFTLDQAVRVVSASDTTEVSGNLTSRTDAKLIAGIVVGIILIGGVIFYFVSRNKKKKVAESAQAQAEEQKRNEQLAVEHKKREDAEKQLREVSKQKEHPKIPVNQPHDDKTMIMKPGEGAAAGAGTKLELEFMMGPLAGQRVVVTQSGLTIGRRAGNGLVIQDETLSGSHAQIYFTAGYFFMKDSGSVNGTYLNGRRITESALKSGDMFKFGKSEGTIRA
jgi:VWFA-related protein